MCQRSTCYARGIFVDIHRGISEEIYQALYHVRKLLIVSMRDLVERSEEITVYAYGNASNFKLEVPRCF